MIYSYDKVATDAVERLHELASVSNNEPPSAGDEDNSVTARVDGEKKLRWDMYQLMQEYAPQDDVIGKLWNEVNTVPEWVDLEQLERGQKIFFRYGGPAISTVS